MTEKNVFKRTLRSLWNAFLYSLSGLRAAIAERAFSQEIILAAILIPASFYLTHDGVARALMIASVLLVPIVELLNSGIEAAIDRISPEWHSLSKKAKDVGSAAVLLALINLVLVWACVLL